MEKYELMLVLKPLLVEDLKDNVIPKINKIVKKHKGDLKLKETIGKRLLAYTIESYKEGYYLLYTLEIDAANVAELSKELQINKDVLRFLVVREDQL